MTHEALQTILALHAAWLRDEPTGKRADLSRANLSGANLSKAKGADHALAQLAHIPAEGPFWAWKKCQNGVLVKLEIPAEAKRSHAGTRKCRAEFVRVLHVFGAEVGISKHDGKTKYKAGEIVKCDSWDENRWKECSGGIHFFLTREEAEAW